MPRAFVIPREQIREDQQRYVDATMAIRRSRLTGPFIVAENSSPDLMTRVAHLGCYFHDRDQADISILSSRVRTFAAIIGARALDGVYEWAAWSGQARDAGVPDDVIGAVREGRTPQDLTEEDALVYEVVTQLVGDGHRLQASTFERALQHFGPQGLVELVTNLAYFSMIAFPLNAFEMGPNRLDAPVLPVEGWSSPDWPGQRT